MQSKEEWTNRWFDELLGVAVQRYDFDLQLVQKHDGEQEAAVGLWLRKRLKKVKDLLGRMYDDLAASQTAKTPTNVALPQGARK